MDCQGAQTQRDNQEDQGTLKQLEGSLKACLFQFPQDFLLALGSLTIHQASLVIVSSVLLGSS